jgi:hypothetical protein
VKATAVGFEHEPLAAPEEVDLRRGPVLADDADVDLRAPNAGTIERGERAHLQPGARQRRPDRVLVQNGAQLRSAAAAA